MTCGQIPSDTCAALLLGLLAAPAGEAEPRVEVLGSEEVRSTVEAFLVPTLPRPVRVRTLPCPGDPSAQGCHSSSRLLDTIWLDPEAGGLDPETVAHEMGHFFEGYMWDLR